MKARISNRAQSDLDRIFARIYVRQGPPAADQFLELAREAAEFIVEHPLAGSHPRWASRHKLLQSGVSIERVLDGRRDVARIMEFGLEDPPELEQ
jgi:plasmid stabilization system protein ParE